MERISGKKKNFWEISIVLKLVFSSFLEMVEGEEVEVAVEVVVVQKRQKNSLIWNFLFVLILSSFPEERVLVFVKTLIDLFWGCQILGVGLKEERGMMEKEMGKKNVWNWKKKKNLLSSVLRLHSNTNYRKYPPQMHNTIYQTPFKRKRELN